MIANDLCCCFLYVTITMQCTEDWWWRAVARSRMQTREGAFHWDRIDTALDTWLLLSCITPFVRIAEFSLDFIYRNLFFIARFFLQIHLSIPSHDYQQLFPFPFFNRLILSMNSSFYHAHVTGARPIRSCLSLRLSLYRNYWVCLRVSVYICRISAFFCFKSCWLPWLRFAHVTTSYQWQVDWLFPVSVLLTVADTDDRTQVSM